MGVIWPAAERTAGWTGQRCQCQQTESDARRLRAGCAAAALHGLSREALPGGLEAAQRSEEDRWRGVSGRRANKHKSKQEADEMESVSGCTPGISDGLGSNAKSAAKRP